jgi:tripartite-type tricarboxylate transporter receptor subunit TctC
MTEAGVPNLEIDSWIGLFAPAKTPPAVIARLQEAIAQSLPELKPRFEQNGGEVIDLAPASSSRSSRPNPTNGSRSSTRRAFDSTS